MQTRQADLELMEIHLHLLLVLPFEVYPKRTQLLLHFVFLLFLGWSATNYLKGRFFSLKVRVISSYLNFAEQSVKKKSRAIHSCIVLFPNYFALNYFSFFLKTPLLRMCQPVFFCLRPLLHRSNDTACITLYGIQYLTLQVI